MTITQQVRNILSASREARNDDKVLQVIYMQKCGMNLSDEQIATFKRMPQLWTVRRIRQHLQEKGEYPADEIVNEKRYETFKNVRQNVSFADELDEMFGN